MSGIDEYNKYWNNKINNYIITCPKIKGFSNYIRTNKALTSVYNYITIIESFLEETGKEPRELTFDDFTDFISKTVKADGTTITNSYQIQKYHALKNYSSYLYETGVITKDFMLSIKRPKTNESQLTLEKREKGYLNKTEIKTYIQSVKNGVGSSYARKCQAEMKARDFAIIMIFLTTGIRRSAMIKLDIGNVDFEQQTLWVTDKGSKVHGYNLNETTIEAIQDWLDQRDKWLQPGNDTDALFLTKYGLRLKTDGIKEIVTKYAADIKGKKITPHKLRATYGTQLYEATKDIYFVQKAMGHSTPAVTERYIRGQKGITKQASDIMSKLI